MRQCGGSDIPEERRVRTDAHLVHDVTFSPPRPFAAERQGMDDRSSPELINIFAQYDADAKKKFGEFYRRRIAASRLGRALSRRLKSSNVLPRNELRRDVRRIGSKNSSRSDARSGRRA